MIGLWDVVGRYLWFCARTASSAVCGTQWTATSSFNARSYFVTLRVAVCKCDELSCLVSHVASCVPCEVLSAVSRVAARVVLVLGWALGCPLRNVGETQRKSSEY